MVKGMMPYPGQDAIDRANQDHWATFNFIRVLKGIDIDGRWAQIPVPYVQGINRFNRIVEYRNGEQDKAIALFAKWASNKVLLGFDGEITLIPIPGSNTTPDSDGLSVASKMAAAICTLGRVQVRVLDILRFDEPMLPARRGGTRDPNIIQEHLVFRNTDADLSAVQHPVLIDDVVSNGAHMQACVAKLFENNIAPEFGLLAGVTQTPMPQSCFSWMETRDI